MFNIEERLISSPPFLLILDSNLDDHTVAVSNEKRKSL